MSRARIVIAGLIAVALLALLELAAAPRAPGQGLPRRAAAPGTAAPADRRACARSCAAICTARETAAGAINQILKRGRRQILL